MKFVAIGKRKKTGVTPETNSAACFTRFYKQGKKL
jgi:hypothetical protein